MFKTNLVRISFVVSVVATMGSLLFGEVLKYPPCTLCWYQRICMYPLAILFLVALWSDDTEVFKYTLPLSLIGFSIASYHVLLYHGIIAENIIPCTQGVSCTTKQIELWGFLTIPFMSWLGFLLINIFSLVAVLKKETPREI